MGASTRGRPSALAWAWSSERRTPCIATRSWTSLTVVRRPTTSTSGEERSTWSAHALSLPLLQASQAFTRGSMPSGAVAQPAADGHAESGIAENLLVLLVEHVLGDDVCLEAMEETRAAPQVQPLVAGIARQAQAHEVAVRTLAHDHERRPEAEALVARERGERSLVRRPTQERLAFGVDRVEVAPALQDLPVEVGVAPEEVEPAPRTAFHLDLDSLRSGPLEVRVRSLEGREVEDREGDLVAIIVIEARDLHAQAVVEEALLDARVHRAAPLGLEVGVSLGEEGDPVGLEETRLLDSKSCARPQNRSVLHPSKPQGE